MGVISLLVGCIIGDANYGLNNGVLKCTFTGFERNNKIKIPFYQVTNKLSQERFISTLSSSVLNKIDPYFVTGLCDGECSFSLAFIQRSTSRLG